MLLAVLGIGDEYYEARRFGGACGIGEGSETQNNFGTVGDTRTEAAHTLAQTDPTPGCQRLSGATWTDVSPFKRCDENSDCGANAATDRCFVTLGSELAMPKDFDRFTGDADATMDCPPGTASNTVFLVGRSGEAVELGATDTINTDDLTGKSYADATTAAAFVRDVEVIDGAGIFSDFFNRSSHKLTLFWQHRSATDWRVWVGFDHNKRDPAAAAGAAPVLEILGSFNVKSTAATPGCGDGLVESARNEECEPGVTTAPTCASLSSSSTVLSGALTCNPATCTWDRSACAFANSPNPFPIPIFPALTCGDGTVQNTSPRFEQCEGATSSRVCSSGGGSWTCSKCLNDPRTCTHAAGSKATLTINDTNNDGISEPFSLTINNLRAQTASDGSTVTAPALQLAFDFDRDKNATPDIVTVAAKGKVPDAPADWFQAGGFGSCANLIGAAECSKWWLRDDPSKPSSQTNGDWARTQQGQFFGGISDWTRVTQKFTWMTNAVGPATATTTENPECFGAATTIAFTENVRGAEQVYMVIDTSGSMDTKDDTNGKKRIEDAQAAAQVYIDRQFGSATTSPLDIGIVDFNTAAKCNGTQADTCALTTLNTEANRVALRAKFDGLVPTGMTAIGDALELARTQFAAKGVKTRERMIYLLSDGHHNAGTLTPDAVLPKLKADGIKVVAIAFGEADEDLLRNISTASGGTMMQARTSDQLPSVFHELAAKSRGDSMLVSRTSGTGSGPVLMASPDAFEFVVPNGGTNLMVLVSAQGAASWDPYVTLVGPTGQAFRKQAQLIDPGVAVRPNAFVMVRVAAPTAGRWKLQLSAPSGSSFNSFLTVSLSDPLSRCFAGVKPFIAVDGNTVEIIPSSNYGDELDPNAVTFTGNIEGPNGFTRALSFTRPTTAQQLFGKERPTALVPVSDLNGRGSYRVSVTCGVPRDAARRKGDAISGKNDLKGPVEPSSYTALNSFFVDTTRMPACSSADCDNDGIPNAQEANVDSDRDGFPDGYDRDADNDDLTDGIDPAPTTPRVPPSTPLTGEPMKIVAGVNTSFSFLPNGLVQLVANINTTKPVRLSRAKLSFVKVLETLGVEYAANLPISFTPAIGSTDLTAFYLSPNGQATVTPTPGGYLIQATLSVRVSKPLACSVINTTLGATTALTLEDGTNPKLTAVASETWRCLTDRLALNQ